MKINCYTEKSVLLMAAILFLAGCGGTKTTSSAVMNDHEQRTEYFREVTRTDSVMFYLHDSVYIRERADTVFVEKWHTRVTYRDRTLIDTLRTSDTVRITSVIHETVEVEANRLTGWQWTQIYAGRMMLLLLVFWSAWLVFKRVLK